MEDKPPAKNPGRILATVLAICLIIIALFLSASDIRSPIREP
ncbi:hypothetical protein [Mesorhizobium sp. GbtcB19]|nr:hypothetical protein [Mesorhizobium sp. GbtcB19]